MCSEKRLQANRLNSQKSTGPTSDEGKQIVSQNALKHGLRGADVVLPDEDPQPFDELRQHLLRDLDPQGPMERLLFDRILSGAWRLRRAHWIEQGIFARNLNDSIERERSYAQHLSRRFQYACASADAMGKLARYENTIDRGMMRALIELKRLQALRRVERCADLAESAHPGTKLAEQSQLSRQATASSQLSSGRSSDASSIPLLGGGG